MPMLGCWTSETVWTTGVLNIYSFSTRVAKKNKYTQIPKCVKVVHIHIYICFSACMSVFHPVGSATQFEFELNIKEKAGVN